MCVGGWFGKVKKFDSFDDEKKLYRKFFSVKFKIYVFAGYFFVFRFPLKDCLLIQKKKKNVLTINKVQKKIICVIQLPSQSKKMTKIYDPQMEKKEDNNDDQMMMMIQDKTEERLKN